MDRRHPAIFVSHTSNDSDAEVSDALVSLLTASMRLDRSAITCTSVIDTGLPSGAPIAVSVRERLQNSSVVLGILTPASIMAPWVMMEMGAAWGLGKTWIPVVLGGLTFKDLPGPSAELNAVEAGDPDSIHSMLMTIGKCIDCDLVGPTDVRNHIDTFVGAARRYSALASVRQSEIVSLGQPQKAITEVLKLLRSATDVLHVSVSPPLTGSRGSRLNKYDEELEAILGAGRLRYTYVANGDDGRRVDKANRLAQRYPDLVSAYLVPRYTDTPRFNYWVIDGSKVVFALHVDVGEDRFYAVTSAALSQSLSWLSAGTRRGVEKIVYPHHEGT